MKWIEEMKTHMPIMAELMEEINNDLEKDFQKAMDHSILFGSKLPELKPYVPAPRVAYFLETIFKAGYDHAIKSIEKIARQKNE